MTYQTIAYSEDGPVGWLVLSRPDAFNAISPAMIGEINQALDRRSESLRVLVVTGAGSVFCAGADLRGVGQTLDGTPALRDFLETCQALFARLRSLPFPVIAGINGIAVAGGLELALSSDIVVASDAATIGDGHANYGVVPGAGSCAILPRIVGPVVAKYLQFTGARMSAGELQQAGLVARVWPDAEFPGELRQLAASIAEKSPLALAHMKRLTDACQDHDIAGVLALELEASTVHAASFDMKEGLSAFAEKRKPAFRGH